MKPPVQHPPYLDASTRAAGGKHGGNETIRTQPNPTLPNKHFLCFAQIPSTVCRSLFEYLRSLFSACRFVLLCLQTLKRQHHVGYCCVWASLIECSFIFWIISSTPISHNIYLKSWNWVFYVNVKDHINANECWLGKYYAAHMKRYSMHLLFFITGAVSWFKCLLSKSSVPFI